MTAERAHSVRSHRNHRSDWASALSKKAILRLDFLRMTSLLCAAAWILVPAPSFAQEKAKAGSAESIQGLREKTRQSIYGFSGDENGELDDATSLGQTLSGAARNLQSSSKDVATRSPDHPNAAPLLRDDFGLPPETPSGPKRVLARPRPAETTNPLVPTPDFSRQKLAFAELAGREVINLPYGELGDQAPVSKDADTEGALGLADLVSVGLDYSPVMERVQAELDSALSHVRQSRADLLPKLSLRSARGPEQTTTVGTRNDHTTVSQTLSLAQPIINLPIVYAWMADLSTHEAAEWRQSAGRESVSQSVANAVVVLAAHRIVLDYADEQLRDFNQLQEYVQARSAVGVVSQSEVERVRTRVLAARQSRIDQQASYRDALSEIKKLTGVMPTSLKLPYLNQLPGLPLTLGDIRSLVRENNPDLRALRADVESQEKTVVSEYGKMLPALGLSIEKDKTENIRGINPVIEDRRVMAVLTWDISLGGKQIFAGKGASSDLVSRQAKLKEQTESALKDTDSDFSQLSAATLRITSAEEEQRAAAAVVAATREQLKNGRLGSLLDALDAIDRHFSARQRLTQALAQQMQAQTKLLSRIGILSELGNYSTVKLAAAPASASADTSSEKSASAKEPVQSLEQSADEARTIDNQSPTEKH